jgi:hypothetical protein
MTTPPTDEHEHEPFDAIDDPDGRPVDGALLGRFIGVAYDGCVTCQDPLLTLLVEDAATTARLVEVACVTTGEILGGLPSSMLPGGPGPASEPFRRLAAAGTDGNREALFTATAAMSTGERRAAANTAADTIIGFMTMR